jgi:lysophospholipase L1-like esterase
MRILVFGDSIAYGSWAAEYGWVELLKREVHRRTVESRGNIKFQVLNLGISGDNSTKILKRMTSEIESRRSDSWPFAFIFSFGTNDARTTNSEPEVSAEQFETNIRAIIRIAMAYTNKILFVGTPPLGQPLTILKRQEYSDERVKNYEERLVAILKAENMLFVPIRPAFEQADLKSLYDYDLHHPNDAGHKLIATSVLPELDKLFGYSRA